MALGRMFGRCCFGEDDDVDHCRDDRVGDAGI
jgi:hypothetical protein